MKPSMKPKHMPFSKSFIGSASASLQKPSMSLPVRLPRNGSAAMPQRPPKASVRDSATHTVVKVKGEAFIAVRRLRSGCRATGGRGARAGWRRPRSRAGGLQHRDRIGVFDPIALPAQRDAEPVVAYRGGEQGADPVAVAGIRKRAREQVLQLVAQLVGRFLRLRQTGGGEHGLQ